MNLSKFNSTKFVATAGAGIATTFLQYMGKLDAAGNSFMLTIIATVGAFITGNVVQAKKRCSRPTKPKKGNRW